MKKNLFLSIFIFSVFFSIFSTISAKDRKIETLSGWQKAKASYYDSKDPSQTKDNCNGIGAFGRRIKSGSIAMGSSFTKDFRKNGMKVFIQVKNCNVVTPYGKGIFRVDDVMAKKYNNKKTFHVDFFYKDLDSRHKRLGRFKIEFRIYKIVKAANSFHD